MMMIFFVSVIQSFYCRMHKLSDFGVGVIFLGQPIASEQILSVSYLEHNSVCHYYMRRKIKMQVIGISLVAQ